MKPLIKLLTVSVVIFQLASCKKDKNETAAPINIKFSQEAFEYVQLQLNRSFIYKDSASGRIDSVVVTESALRDIFVPRYDCKNAGAFSFCTPNPDYTYQRFTLKLINFNSFNNPSNQIWFADSAISYIYGSAGGFYIAPTDTAYLNLGGSFWYPYKYSQSPSQTNVLASFDVEGKTYTNVLQFISSTTTNVTDPYYKKTIYYWAKGIGIIKREIRTNNSIKTDLLLRYS